MMIWKKILLGLVFAGLTFGVFLSTLVFLYYEQPQERIAITSKILGEERYFDIYLPESYSENSGKKYPVLYVLDGERNRLGALTSMWSRFLDIPETIIVAIDGQGKRWRDYLPETSMYEGRELGGQATSYAEHLEQELLPTIDRRFRTAEWRGISGHSSGGLFSIFVFAAKPNLFQAHLAYSPALLLDKPFYRYLEDRQKKPYGDGQYLYFNLGIESEGYTNSVEESVKYLENLNETEFKWHYSFHPLPHPLIMISGQYQGMKKMFD